MPPTGLHIDRWTRGLVTNRAATSTPFKYVGLNVVSYKDALIDGSNVEVSPANTLVRRPGWSKYCSASFGSETPKGFTDAIIGGNLYKFLDTDQNVYTFDTSTLTSIFAKSTTAQTFFQQIGNILYLSDGTNNQKFTVGQAGDTHVTNAGVATPVSAPTIPGLNFFSSPVSITNINGSGSSSLSYTSSADSIAWKFTGAFLGVGSGLTFNFQAAHAGFSTSWIITAASLQKVAAGSTSGAPILQTVDLTFNGSSTVTIVDGTNSTCDFVPITISPNFDYWLVLYTANSPNPRSDVTVVTVSPSVPPQYGLLSGDKTGSTTLDSWVVNGSNFYGLGAVTIYGNSAHAWVPEAVYTSGGSPSNYYLLAPTGEIQWAVVPAGTTLQSQSSAPSWPTGFGVFGSTTKDGTMSWTNCGPPSAWAASTLYENSSFVAVSQMSAQSTTNTPATSGSTSVNWTVTSTGAGISPSTGTTGNSNTFKISNLGLGVPVGATINGVQVTANRGTNRANSISDVTVQLLKAGTAAGNNKAAAGFWPQTIWNAYNVPTIGQSIAQNYGSNTDLWGTTLTPADINNSGFGLEWVINQGSTRTTTAALVFPITITVYYTIASSDISGAVYAQIVTDSNGNLQRVFTGGTSGSGAPSWATTIGAFTTDNTATWQCLGTANQLPCLFNRTYASSFHTSSPHTSTLSPLLVVQAPIIGQNVPVQGFGSDDIQVDRNDLYRTADGGSLLLYDSTTPNVGSTTAWTITDTALDSDLNFEIIGPVADANDPPPVGMTILAYHMGRLWGAVGNSLFFSAGPDCINGDGNQAWPPANQFLFAGNITSLAPTSAGLVVLTADERSIVLGGPQTETFWVQPLLKGRGVLSPNCSAQDGDEIASYTSARQFFGVSANGENEIGNDIALGLASTFDPTLSYVAIHRSGQDQGIFISDGSANIQRYNLNNNNWDAIAAPANGIGPLASIETVIGTRTLVSTAGGFIVFRDTGTFSDAGTTYPAFATVGSIVLSEPGEKPVSIKTIILTSVAVGSALAVSVLPNEISGSFTAIPLSASDPPELPASSTLNMKVYAWMGVQTPLANWVKHFQTKITFPTEAAKNEIYSMSIIPK